MKTPGAAARSPYRLIDELNREWERLVGEHDAGRDLVAGWARRWPQLGVCEDLVEVLGQVRRRPDPTLAALLAECAGGDLVAGRVVLQAMLGKIVRMASTDRFATAGDYVSALWCRIQSYPLTTRPRRIAANLALDTLKAVVRDRGDLSARECVQMSPDLVFDQLCDEILTAEALDHSRVSRLDARRVVSTATRLGLVDRTTGDVLLSVYEDGLSGRDAARRHRLSPALVRSRCSRAVRCLADHAVLLADAA